MKKSIFITITALVGFGLAGCATTADNAKTDDQMMKSEATMNQVATCDPTVSKCETGGGVVGPIGNNTEVATCKEGDPGYPKCTTGGGVVGPIGN